MSALQSLLDTYRSTSVTEREKGTYFEELICAYLRNEATREGQTMGNMKLINRPLPGKRSH